MFFGDRSKRIEKIVASAAPHLEQGEDVRELVQIQTGRSAAANELAVYNAWQQGSVNWWQEGRVHRSPCWRPTAISTS